MQNLAQRSGERRVKCGETEEEEKKKGEEKIEKGRW
jgi:hypothetical protein